MWRLVVASSIGPAKFGFQLDGDEDEAMVADFANGRALSAPLDVWQASERYIEVGRSAEAGITRIEASGTIKYLPVLVLRN